MSVRKDARVVYYPASPASPELRVPAHVRLHWFDEQGRQHHQLLGLTDEEVARVAAIPDAFGPQPPLVVEPCFGCRDFWDVRELSGHVCPRCRERGAPG